jgi:hypothetical protein
MLREIGSKEDEEEKKSIELVGRTKSYSDSCFTNLTYHIVDGGCAKVNIARPSKSIMKSDRSNTDRGYATINFPRKSKCNKKNDRKTRMTKVSVKKKSFSFKKQCYLRYLCNQRRLFAD